MKACILGQHGLIGSAVAKKIKEQGGTVTSNPTKDVDVVINLASPTHLKFQENVEYHMAEAIGSAQVLLPFCATNNIPYLYASSALVYEPEKKFALRNCKLILEQMAEAYGGKTLGLRIFPVYGPGEGTTAITQWCNAMNYGERPIIYGDGTQERDFIYVDDVADNIINLISQTGIVDVAGGHPISFNEVVKVINEELGTSLEPTYVGAPTGYSKGVTTDKPLPTKVSIHDGIRKILGQPLFFGWD